jgi:hypothetical protein
LRGSSVSQDSGVDTAWGTRRRRRGTSFHVKLSVWPSDHGCMWLALAGRGGSMVVGLQWARNAPHAVPGCPSGAAFSTQSLVASAATRAGSSKVCFRAPCLWLQQQRGPWWLNAEAVPLATTRFDHRPGCTAAVFPTPRTRCPNPTPNGASSHLLCLCSAALCSAVFPPHLCRTVAGSDSLAPYSHHSARLHWRCPR